MLARVLGGGFRWPSGAQASRLGGAVVLVVVVATVAWRVFPAFSLVIDELRATHGLTRLERELAPARAVDIDPRPIEAAAMVIPEDATFAVLVGKDYPFTHEISRLTLPAWAAYRLLPRRRVLDAAEAEWVISYDADLAASRVVPDRTIHLGLDVTLARVR